MEIDLFAPDFVSNPYPVYARLREMPVTRSPMGVWLIARHQDVLSILRGGQVSSQFSRYSAHARQKRSGALAEVSDHLLPLLDPPVHTRLRSLVAPLFRDQVLERVVPAIPGLINDLLEPLEGEFDLMERIASPLPVLVISELLGIPRADRERVRGWAHEFFSIFSASRSQAQLERLQQALEGFRDYLKHILLQRQDQPQEDLLSLIAAQPELSLDERCATCVLLFANGEETLGHFLGNAVLALQSHGAWKDPLHWGLAMEELLRYDTPSQILGRTAGAELRVGEVTIPEGEPVYLLLGSANHDERAFAAPAELSLERAPNPHLSFGHGTHACLGAWLARRQAQLALSACLRELPSLRLSGTPRWRGHPFRRGLTHLPVCCERKRRRA